MVNDGLFHVLVPRELGGAGGTATDWFDTSVAVAHADPSAGWIMSQGAVENAWIAVAGEPDFAARFFSTRQTIASSAAGHATAERDGENFLVRDGRWAYVSGCQGAAYVGGMVRVPAPGGAVETLMVLAPAALATIENSWDTHGLRGTGSHHVNLGDQITIPASQTFTWPKLTITRPGTLATAATHTRWLISTCAAAVNLGAARRALEVAMLRQNTRATASSPCPSPSNHRSSARLPNCTEASSSRSADSANSSTNSGAAPHSGRHRQPTNALASGSPPPPRLSPEPVSSTKRLSS